MKPAEYERICANIFRISRYIFVALLLNFIISMGSILPLSLTDDAPEILRQHLLENQIFSLPVSITMLLIIYLTRTHKLHKVPLIYWWVVLRNNKANFIQVFNEPYVDQSRPMARTEYIHNLRNHIEENTNSLYYIDTITDSVYFANKHDALLLRLKAN